VATFLPIDVETPRPLVLTLPSTDAELEALGMAIELFRFERNREGNSHASTHRIPHQRRKRRNQISVPHMVERS
jgi:hypothetical protein